MVGRLLVVNDEPRTGRALQGALASEGFGVILAGDDAQALDVVQGTEPDAVIVDVVEPDARGTELCRRLREASPRLPVLMLGEGDTLVERTAGLAAGADDYLARPFALVELLTRIRRLLRRKQPHRLGGPALPRSRPRSSDARGGARRTADLDAGVTTQANVFKAG